MTARRIAVCGSGSIGRRHLRNLRGAGCLAVFAYDPSPDAAAAAAAELNVTACTDLDSLWRLQPQVLFVTSPSSEHLALALEGARRGCDLFVEKPVSDRLDGLAELRRIVEDRGLVTMVGCNMRFHPGPAAVKRLVDAGAVGRVIAGRIHTGSYLPGWRPWMRYEDSYSADPARGGGALLDCIHEIDLALWYFGRAELLASAVRRADTLGIAVDGLAELLLEHESGVLSSVHLNFVQRDYRRSCQVIGDTGTIYWDFDRPQVSVLRGGDQDEVHPLDPQWQPSQMYVDELSAFLAAVERREQTFSTIADGEAALRIALAARAHAVRTEKIQA
ncbi:MAG TPA: Gfo/Idh/MocA family oxidoreductase [Vicinamibacterales bacterium]|nr:Gfo/Idh/MocA family oxidoreductase [Vicinamibacterales bacterium]